MGKCAAVHIELLPSTPLPASAAGGCKISTKASALVARQSISSHGHGSPSRGCKHGVMLDSMAEAGMADMFFLRTSCRFLTPFAAWYPVACVESPFAIPATPRPVMAGVKGCDEHGIRHPAAYTSNQQVKLSGHC